MKTIVNPEKKKLGNSQRRKLGKLYSKALINLFVEGKILEPEMDKIVTDIQVLHEITKKRAWIDWTQRSRRLGLTTQEILKIFEDAIFPHVSLEFTKVWITKHINENHFPVLVESYKYFLRQILLVDVKVPEYIKITEKHKEKIKNFVENFYKNKITERGQIGYIKLSYEYVKTEPKFRTGDEFVKLANQLFDFNIDIIEKKIIKV